MGNSVSSMKRFFKSFSDTSRIDEVAGLDAAIRAASNGKFWTYKSLLNSFTSDWEKAVKNGGMSAKKFAEQYCGMNFSNSDTGSVIGLDAGGKTAYTKATIVADTVPMDKWKLPTSNKTVIEGCTFVWSKTKNLSAKETYLLKGLNSSWLKSALDLINKSYGLSFKNDMAKCKTITVNFVSDNDQQRSAWVSASGGNYANKITLNINVKSNFNTKSIHGEVLPPKGYEWTGGPNYTDVTLGHELVHALVFASIPGALWPDFMTGLSEGLAEFAIGADGKDRLQNIEYIFSKSNFSKFKTTMSFGTRTNYGNVFYGPATAFLHYMVKNGLSDAYRYTNSGKTSMALTSAFSGTYNMTSWKGVKNVDARENKKVITIKGTAEANTIYVNKKTTTLSALAGNDKIYVQGGTEHKINAGDGDDKITLSAGTKSTVSGNNGIDTITVSGGSENKFYGNAGNDVFTIKGGKNSYYYGSTGVDTFTLTAGTGNVIYGQQDGDKITLSGGSKNTAHGGVGKDTMTITNGTNNRVNGNDDVDTLTISGGSSNIAVGNAGNDVLYIKGGTGNKAYGYEDNDKLYLSAGDGNFLYGNAGNDTLFISGGTNGIAYGQEGNDTMTITAGINNKIYGNNGDDKLYIKGGTGSYASGNEGNDTIYVSAGESGTVYGGNGADKVYVSGGTNFLINMGDGDDLIQVTAGSGNEFYGVTGNDTFNIKGGTHDIFHAGQGNNIFNIDAVNFKGSSTITLKGYDKTATNVFRFKGTLTENGSSKTVGYFADYTFKKEDANLIVSNGTSSITIEDWDNHKSSLMYFADGSKRTYDAIKSFIKLQPVV